jgi:hypothetical protein
VDRHPTCELARRYDERERRWREPLVCGLLLTVTAPPVAALVFILASRTIGGDAPLDILAWIGLSIGAFILGALPAFGADLHQWQTWWLTVLPAFAGVALPAAGLAHALLHRPTPETP